MLGKHFYKQYSQQSGFSLLEMAVVLIILGVLLGGLIVPLSSQREVNNRKQTEEQLKEIHDAILGFAAANGRLPCPAAGNDGLSSEGPPGTCTAAYPNTSFVPYRTLGIQGPLDQNGRLIDAWHFAIRYRLANNFPINFTDGITQAEATAGGNIQVCTVACPPAPVAPERILTTNAVAVLVSLGSDGATVPAVSINQAENTDNDTDFVMREPSTTFNDIVIWLSPNKLMLTLVDSGIF